MSLAHDLLMMAPVGTPLEDIVYGTDFETCPQFQMSKDDCDRYIELAADGLFEIDGVQWSVEKIGRRVYTFALDDFWEEEPKR